VPMHQPALRTAAPGAAECHALAVRLATPVETAPIERRLAGRMPFAIERLPAGPGDPAARRRRERELARPVPAEPGARAVLIAYSDGSADLVLVARRDRLDRDTLIALARPARVPHQRRPAEPAVPPPSAAPAWGLGDGSRDGRWAEFRRPVSGPADPASWRAALDAVLARYEPDASPDSSPVVLTFDGATTAPDEYVPFLAPTHPLAVQVSRAPGGGAELRCRHRIGAVSPAAAALFVEALATAHGEPDRSDAAAAPSPPVAARDLTELFAEQVAARATAVAVSDDRGRHTYAELDAWSTRLARGLRAAGVRDGDTVGVCLDRSAELVAVLLAILKAGAAYVPLDAAYPADRLAYTVADAGLTVVVTTAAGFPPASGVRLLTPASLALSPESPGEPGGGDPARPAYVIYTSGSTGRPKGVVVPHANVAALLDATREEYALGPADVWTFFHSAAFDFSVWEIWGCLLTGGHLVVVPYWISRSPDQFHELLAERGVTVLSQTPSSFTQLVAADRAAPRDLAVRLVIFGGEPLDARTVLPWLDRRPEARCRLVNMFGITETTVHVTAVDVTRSAALAGSRSVGRPLPGWAVRVLDGERRDVPPGVPGEIYVGGAGVATGYLNRPELTAERFVTDPATGQRWYRSGDRGRLLPDGTLEHLGRLDDQVKLRGFRIELDEIRGVLTECPGVAAATVVVRRAVPDDPATARLDAYVVADAGATPLVAEHAARMLPSYMCPATVTVLDALPMTPNGKVDRAALPEPARPAADKADDAGAPGRPGEDGLAGDLAEVWRQIFGCPVGVSDNFFALGGNSLLAVRMAALMRSRGLPRLHPRTLYLHPTVRGLADALRSA
jgi:amino acid adenylation domain-containing protein